MQDEVDSAGVPNGGLQAAEENVVPRAYRLSSVGKADFSRHRARPMGPSYSSSDNDV